MTAEEIRALEIEIVDREGVRFSPDLHVQMFVVYREIAAHLAELNERLRELTTGAVLHVRMHT